MEKQCTSCGVLKTHEAFHKRSASPDGLNASCKTCRSTARKGYQSQKDYNKYYREVHRESLAVAKREWDLNNREHIRAYKRLYRKLEPVKHSHWDAKKKASRLKRTPSWLDKSQIEQIKVFYWLRDDLRAVTGMSYEVDHIVPLQGRNVCGLHVPWNLQILPADVNNKKSNFF